MPYSGRTKFAAKDPTQIYRVQSRQIDSEAFIPWSLLDCLVVTCFISCKVVAATSSTMSEPPDVSISGLLRKTEHYDKDERYMATSDLCEVLKRQQQQQTNPTSELDSKTEHQICAAVLRLLHDQSNDVQAVAVKTLGVLLMTVKEAQVFEIADSLADQVLDATKSELRDVYAIGLRTLVKIIPFAMGNAVSQRLVGRMLEGIKSSENEEIVLVCLDILTDVLTRFGYVLIKKRGMPFFKLLALCFSNGSFLHPSLSEATHSP
jgi:hypothetical protein